MEELDKYIDSKIEQADADADMWWKMKAEEYAIYLATKKKMLTTDDLLIWLDDHGYHTKNNSAIGAIIRKLKSEGVIAFAGYTTSRRPTRCRNPIRVWKSQIYEGETL